MISFFKSTLPSYGQGVNSTSIVITPQLYHKSIGENCLSFQDSSKTSMLEDSILKKNVPGRYSSFDLFEGEPERNDTSNDENDANDEDKTEQGSQHADRSKDDVMPGGTGKSGVKGVIADYNYAKQMEKLNIQEKQAIERNLIRRSVEGSVMGPNEESISIAFQREQERRAMSEKNHALSDSGSSDSDFDDDDDEWMKAYRATRLQQLQSSSIIDGGTIADITDASHMAEIIDGLDSRYFCIVALYEPNECCDQLIQNLKVLSNTMSSCKMHKYLVKGIGMPCVMIYKNGEELANLTPITKYWNHQKDFTPKDVQTVLESFGVQ